MPYVLVADGIITQDQYEESIRRLTDGSKSRIEFADEWPVPGLLSHTGARELRRTSAPGPRDIGAKGEPEIHEAHTYVSA